MLDSSTLSISFSLFLKVHTHTYYVYVYMCGFDFLLKEKVRCDSDINKDAISRDSPFWQSLLFYM